MVDKSAIFIGVKVGIVIIMTSLLRKFESILLKNGGFGEFTIILKLKMP